MDYERVRVVEAFISFLLRSRRRAVWLDLVYSVPMSLPPLDHTLNILDQCSLFTVYYDRSTTTNPEDIVVPNLGNPRVYTFN